VRILVAEDEPAAAWLLEKGLREHGYEVDLVRGGMAALARAASFSYDPLLLDLGLPGKDGLDVCRELRDRGLALPVLMLTARDAVQDRIAGLDPAATTTSSSRLALKVRDAGLGRTSQTASSPIQKPGGGVRIQHRMSARRKTGEAR
jgi:two-component system, OmpR family, response regulator